MSKQELKVKLNYTCYSIIRRTTVKLEDSLNSEEEKLLIVFEDFHHIKLNGYETHISGRHVSLCLLLCICTFPQQNELKINL